MTYGASEQVINSFLTDKFSASSLLTSLKAPSVSESKASSSPSISPKLNQRLLNTNNRHHCHYKGVVQKRSDDWDSLSKPDFEAKYLHPL